MHRLKNYLYRLLRSSESFIKLDMIYLTKGSLWTTLRFAIGTLASLATMVAFGNLLPKETYGTYNYLLSLAASLSFLTLSGIGYAVIRAVAKGFQNIVPAALKLQLKYNLLAVATILAVALYYAYKGNMVFAAALAMLSIAYPIAEAFHLYEPVLIGLKRFDLLTKVSSFITLTTSLSTVIALFFTQNVLVLVAVYSLSALIPNIIAYLISTRGLDKSRPDPERIREMRRTAFHITGAGIIGTMALYLDKIILFHIAGGATLAVYGFAIAGPERLKGLIKSWVSISLPRSAVRSLDEIEKVFSVRMLFSIFIGIAMAGTYILLSPFLFQIFLPKYIDAIKYTQVYALGLLAIPTTAYIGNIFGGQNMLRAIYAHTLTGYIVRISLFLLLGWKWQIWGLIAASIISSFLTAISGIIILKMETRRLRHHPIL